MIQPPACVNLLHPTIPHLSIYPWRQIRLSPHYFCVSSRLKSYFPGLCIVCLRAWVSHPTKIYHKKCPYNFFQSSSEGKNTSWEMTKYVSMCHIFLKNSLIDWLIHALMCILPVAISLPFLLLLVRYRLFQLNFWK